MSDLTVVRQAAERDHCKCGARNCREKLALARLVLAMLDETNAEDWMTDKMRASIEQCAHEIEAAK